jgi:hypothetical protein
MELGISVVAVGVIIILVDVARARLVDIPKETSTVRYVRTVGGSYHVRIGRKVAGLRRCVVYSNRGAIRFTAKTAEMAARKARSLCSVST